MSKSDQALEEKDKEEQEQEEENTHKRERDERRGASTWSRRGAEGEGREEAGKEAPMRQGAGGDMMHEQQQGVEGGYMDMQTMGFNLVHPEGALTRLARSLGLAIASEYRTKCGSSVCCVWARAGTAPPNESRNAL